jgi:hypothetical protein
MAAVSDRLVPTKGAVTAPNHRKISQGCIEIYDAISRAAWCNRPWVGDGAFCETDENGSTRDAGQAQPWQRAGLEKQAAGENHDHQPRLFLRPYP